MMKRTLLLLLFVIISLSCIVSYAIDNFDIVLKSKWQQLGCNDNTCTDFGGKWIVIGSITFKRRSKDPIFVDKINLRWHGENLDNLIASLYRKTIGKEFLAIEQNLICDGQWNPKTQTLILDFDEEEKLGTTSVFYLVLTIPEAIEPILKRGHFCLENNCLPHPFKQCAQNEKLILAINDTTSKGLQS
jgi:hypothetical protein